MQIQTASENVCAFIDMMGMATGVAGDRLALGEALKKLGY